MSKAHFIWQEKQHSELPLYKVFGSREFFWFAYERSCWRSTNQMPGCLMLWCNLLYNSNYALCSPVEISRFWLVRLGQNIVKHKQACYIPLRTNVCQIWHTKCHIKECCVALTCKLAYTSGCIHTCTQPHNIKTQDKGATEASTPKRREEPTSLASYTTTLPRSYRFEDPGCTCLSPLKKSRWSLEVDRLVVSGHCCLL